jgi:hypothetical protein
MKNSSDKEFSKMNTINNISQGVFLFCFLYIFNTNLGYSNETNQ